MYRQLGAIGWCAVDGVADQFSVFFDRVWIEWAKKRNRLADATLFSARRDDEHFAVFTNFGSEGLNAACKESVIVGNQNFHFALFISFSLFPSAPQAFL